METVSKLQHLRSPAEEIYIIFYHCIVLEICIAWYQVDLYWEERHVLRMRLLRNNGEWPGFDEKELLNAYFDN